MHRARYTLALLTLWTVHACSEPVPEERSYPVGDGPGVVLAVDVNGDGKPDIVTVNERSEDATILLNAGKGGFAPAPGSPVKAGHMPNDATTADFDHDGHPDVAFANHESQQLTVLLGDGKGSFRPAPGSPVPVAVKPHPHGVAAGDFDGDGNVDLVTDSWGEDKLEIFPGDGKGNFRTPGIYVKVGKHPYQRVRAADLDHDGIADIVSPNLDGNDVTILLGGKQGLHEAKGSPFPCGDAPFNVAIGDVNGDGNLDLAIVDSPSSTGGANPGKDGLSVLLGDGHGTFRPAPDSPYPLGRQPNLVAIGDLDGDGTGEVAVSNPDLDRVTVFRFAPGGEFIRRREISIPGHPKGLAIADLDGDREAELIVGGNASDRVSVLPHAGPPSHE